MINGGTIVPLAVANPIAGSAIAVLLVSPVGGLALWAVAQRAQALGACAGGPGGHRRTAEQYVLAERSSNPEAPVHPHRDAAATPVARSVPSPATWLKRGVYEMQGYLELLGAIARGLTSRPIYRRDIIHQLDAIGIGSLTVVTLTGVFTGMVLALQAGITMDQFGARAMVGRLVSASMIKELGPVLTALMVTARVGSGIAAELGSMTVTEQIAALRTLGTDPVRKLVVPRVVAGVLMLPVLTVVANAVGILGGWVISTTQLHVASSVYWNNVVAGLYIQDVWMGLIKPFALGFVIMSIAAHVGLRTSGGTQGVGRATTNAVVAGSVAVLAVDFLLTKLLIALLY